MLSKAVQSSRPIRATSTTAKKQEESDEKSQNHNNSYEQYTLLPVLDKPARTSQAVVKVINMMSGLTPIKQDKNLEMYKQQQKRRNMSLINKKTNLNVNIRLADNQIDLKIKQSNQNKIQLKVWLNSEEGFAPSYLPNRLKQTEARLLRQLTPVKFTQTQNLNQTPENQNELDRMRFQQLQPIKLSNTLKKSRKQSLSLSERNQTIKDQAEDEQLQIKEQTQVEEEELTHPCEMNVDQFVLLDGKLNLIMKNIKIHNHQELLTVINDYLELVITGEFHLIENLFADERHKKMIRQAMLMERIGIVVLVNSFFEGHFFLVNISNFRNILMYAYQNYYMLCELMLRLTKSDQLKQVLNNKMVKVSNKKLDVWNNLKQNTEMLQNLYKQLTKNTRDLNQFLVNYMRTCNQINLKQSFRSLLEFTSLYFTMQQSYQGMLGVTLLTVAPEPYLPEIKNRIFTLVLDMDETLVHFSESPQGGQFQIRPYAIQFLTEMQEYYELVVFTAGLPDYANWVLNSIDPSGMILYRLFRHHAIHQGNIFIKDLSRMGRDLSKCIIVDNVAENFTNQPDNGIFIKAWYSDPNDTALAELGPLLKQIVIKQYDDVRVALKHFKDQMIHNIQSGIHAPHLNLQL